MARKNWPVLGGPPLVLEKGLALIPRVAPVIAAAMISTIKATPTPL